MLMQLEVLWILYYVARWLGGRTGGAGAGGAGISQGISVMKAKFDYNSEALRLAKAIDLAIDAFQKYSPQDWSTQQVAHFVRVYSDWKSLALNPAPQYKKAVSLNYIIQDVFTYFQEGNGDAVDHFWSRINKENLGYCREDKLRKILRKSKLKSRAEYECVTDLLVVAKQEGRINEQEVNKLSKMIDEFENRKK